MIIAIDGPAGSGKSTIARNIAKYFSITFMNTGSFYRGVTLALLRSMGSKPDGSGGVLPDLSNEQKIIDFARCVNLDYRNSHLYLDNEDVESYLRSDAVESIVAPLSAIVEVRHILNEKIRKIARATGVVCEGRDMTTVVFPDADFKFYLDASVSARALRRYNQGTSSKSLSDLEAAIAERDDVDRNKKEGSLKIAPDAFYIDTSDLTIEVVCAIIISKIQI